MKISRVAHSRKPQKEIIEASTYEDPCRATKSAI
jgi:hypothetical protein